MVFALYCTVQEQRNRKNEKSYYPKKIFYQKLDEVSSKIYANKID